VAAVSVQTVEQVSAWRVCANSSTSPRIRICAADRHRFDADRVPDNRVYVVSERSGPFTAVFVALLASGR